MAGVLEVDWVNTVLEETVSDLKSLCLLTQPPHDEDFPEEIKEMIIEYIQTAESYNNFSTLFDDENGEARLELLQSLNDISGALFRLLRDPKIAEKLPRDQSVVKTSWFGICNALFELIAFTKKRFSRLLVVHESFEFEEASDFRLSELAATVTELEIREKQLKDILSTERQSRRLHSSQAKAKKDRLTVEKSSFQQSFDNKSVNLSKTLEQEIKIENERHAKSMAEMKEDLSRLMADIQSMSTDHKQREIAAKKKVQRNNEELQTKKIEYENYLEATTKSNDKSQELLNVELESLQDLKKAIVETKREAALIGLNSTKVRSLVKLKTDTIAANVTTDAEIQELAAIILQAAWRGRKIRKHLQDTQSFRAKRKGEVASTLTVTPDVSKRRPSFSKKATTPRGS